ncbi:MAG TPA: YggT family protein [Steroidobacteraceae bacterium]|nr:YggT family protein [Steroidobacteraceae bacterium]
MSALLFIADTLLTLALFAALLRLFMQWSRADFRNPISQAVVRITNPVIMPLRRILPPVGRIDTASVVAVLLAAVLYVAVMSLLADGAIPPSGLTLLRAMVVKILHTTLWLYFYAIFLYALLGLIVPGGYSPMQSLLTSLCEPVLRPIRRIIPAVGGLDLSPLWAGILIQALLLLLH